MNRDEALAYVKLQLPEYLEKERGINLNDFFHCLNPDHEDKHPSMRYDPKRNKCHCFACGEDYSLIDIIGIIYGLETNSEMIAKAYEIYNITFDDDRDNKSVTTADKSVSNTTPVNTCVPATSLALSADLTSFFNEAHSRIAETDYPSRRGLSLNVINRFCLGFVSDWNPPESPKAPPSPRLIIPTSTESYFARDTRDKLTEAEKKYTKIKIGPVQFFNSNALFRGTVPVFITEGEIDAMSIMSVSDCEAVALGSTASIGKFVDYVTYISPRPILLLALDSDAAGIAASQKLADELSAVNFPFLLTSINGTSKDPNDALLADKIAFSNDISNTLKFAYDFTQCQQGQVSNYLNALQFQFQYSETNLCIPTGFQELDTVLDRGLYPGLYTIGAVSSLGKTTFVMQMADQIAQQGTDVLIFSLEMSRKELVSKSISKHTFLRSQLNSTDALTCMSITNSSRYSNFNPTQKRLILDSFSDYRQYANHIYIYEGVGNMGINEIRYAVTRHIALKGVTPVVIIDYLQILAPHNEKMSDKQNTDYATIELKRISRDCNTPVIAISSFNRANYKSEVSMESFKESGAVEYSSDVLIGLQLHKTGDAKFNILVEKQRTPRRVEAVILKNRNGVVGNHLLFNYYPMFNFFEQTSCFAPDDDDDKSQRPSAAHI